MLQPEVVNVGGLDVMAFASMQQLVEFIVHDDGTVFAGSAIAINPEKVMKAREDAAPIVHHHQALADQDPGALTEQALDLVAHLARLGLEQAADQGLIIGIDEGDILGHPQPEGEGVGEVVPDNEGVTVPLAATPANGSASRRGCNRSTSLAMWRSVTWSRSS